MSVFLSNFTRARARTYIYYKGKYVNLGGYKDLFQYKTRVKGSKNGQLQAFLLAFYRKMVKNKEFTN